MRIDKSRKRYICSFVKKTDDGKLKPNVVVVVASNPIMARAVLCEIYEPLNVTLKGSDALNNKAEGIKSIRESETNKYEGVKEGDDFSDNSEL